MFDTLQTPSLLLDIDRTEANLRSMQAQCDAHGVELRPHNKTHKMVQMARRQLAYGARGLTCAKISEAQALVPSGAKEIFLAHSLADPRKAPALRKLADSVEQLVVACTSEAQAPALEALLAAADLTLPVMLSLNSGLGREGARGVENAVRLAEIIQRQPHMKLHGIYTHEGHLYSVPPAEADAAIRDVHCHLLAARDAVAKVADGPLRLWPGCSVSAHRMAALPEVDAVRPGAYVFGDLSLTEMTDVMEWDDIAVTILATVVDKPEPGLALIDAGSKVFSSDRMPCGKPLDKRDFYVARCSEEHGFVNGSEVDSLKVGDRIRFVPAHICAVINLANQATIIRNDDVVDTWNVDARGCVL